MTKEMNSIFPLWTFYLYVATFQQCLYISWYIISELLVIILIFLRGLLLTRKLQNQGFLVVKLKSLLRKFYGSHHDLVNCYRKTVKNYHEHEYVLFPHASLIISLTQRVSVVEQNLPTLQEHLSSSQFYSGAEPAYPSRASEFISVL